MQVFICWSGYLSREVALALRRFLPAVLPALKDRIFMSEEDIALGQAWAAKVADKLEESNFGILCMTGDNMLSPWPLFEAGALSKHRDGRVCPLLLGDLSREQLSGPLTAFQSKAFGEASIRELVTLLNDLQQTPTESGTLSQAFSREWGELEGLYRDRVAKTPSRPRTATEVESYSRELCKVPDDHELIPRLAEMTEAVRRDALAWIREHSPECAPQNGDVRANIFVPDVRSQHAGYVFELCMHMGLKFQMDLESEWTIRFGPGEGATGAAFESRLQIARSKRDFNLSERHKSAVHEELRWFVSTPVEGRKRIPLVVLNVDGIHFDLTDDQLEKLAQRIRDKVATLDFADVLDRLPKYAVSVRFTDLGA